MTPGLSLLTLTNTQLINEYMEVDDNEAREYKNNKDKGNEESLREGGLYDGEVLINSSYPDGGYLVSGSSFHFHGGALMGEHCTVIIALVLGICWMVIGLLNMVILFIVLKFVVILLIMAMAISMDLQNLILIVVLPLILPMMIPLLVPLPILVFLKSWEICSFLPSS